MKSHKMCAHSLYGELFRGGKVDRQCGRFSPRGWQENSVQMARLRRNIHTRPTVVTAMDRGTAKELLAHFGKAASNLNQIARVLNQGYPADTGIINEIRNCIQQMLRGAAVLEAVGG